MSNLHQLDIIPEKSTINLMATYTADFEDDSFNYHQLLRKLKNTMLICHFMDKEDNAAWMRHQGYDYLSNPKLFSHAPLTYLCAFLSEIFKQLNITDIMKKIPPNTFKAALKRLSEFKL